MVNQYLTFNAQSLFIYPICGNQLQMDENLMAIQMRMAHHLAKFGIFWLSIVTSTNHYRFKLGFSLAYIHEISFTLLFTYPININ